MNSTFSIGNICSIILDSTVSSSSGMLWKIITFLWPWQWIFIFLSLTIWIVFELKTRHGTAHYNSENGFSPAFNRFVGSGLYLGLQTVLFLILEFFFGSIVYCLGWPYILHVTVFLSTGLLLNISGFWPYLKEPKKRRHYKKRKK